MTYRRFGFSIVGLAAAVGLSVIAAVLGSAVGAEVRSTGSAHSHAMHPALGASVRYQFEGNAAADGAVKFRCQTRPQDGSKGPWCYGPDQIRAAYDIQSVLNSGIDGAGRTIVIIDAFQSPTIAGDLKLFDTVWGLPDPTFNVIAPDGLTPFNPNDANQVGWSAEISLDVQWAHAIAPKAAIDLVLAKDNNDDSILSVTRFAVEHNLGDVISQSFGEGEICMDPAIQRAQHEVFKEAVEKGITLFASSGDQGSAQPTCDGTSFFLSASTPATDPNVTAVGGTTLFADGVSGAYHSERVWNEQPRFGAGGGGFSVLYKRPGYQAPFSKNHARGVPDISYDAGVFGGVLAAWGVPFGPGAFFIFGGTSAGSPQWSGITALADQKFGERLGSLNRALYHVGKKPNAGLSFRDITEGNNAWIVAPGVVIPGFAAGPGWDAASGLGTPDVANLLNVLGHEGEGGPED